MRLDDNLVVLVPVDLDHIFDDVRELNARSINLHAQLLSEIDLDVCHFEGDRLRPAGMFCLSSIVRHTN